MTSDIRTVRERAESCWTGDDESDGEVVDSVVSHRDKEVLGRDTPPQDQPSSPNDRSFLSFFLTFFALFGVALEGSSASPSSAARRFAADTFPAAPALVDDDANDMLGAVCLRFGSLFVGAASCVVSSLTVEVGKGGNP